MPLSADESVNQTAVDLVSTLQGIFGHHAGYRPAHAHGALLTGSFTPTSRAAELSCAPHLTASSTPVTVRFSSSTGIPTIPDTDPNANPRGIAIRFHLPSDNNRRRHTDIIAHSTPHFPARTGAEFLEMLRAIAASGPDVPSPKPIEQFLAAHPAALAFVQAPKPSPASFATAEFYGLNAFKLVAADGTGTFVRYVVTPTLGLSHLDDADLAAKPPSYLFDALPGQVPMSFHLRAQVALPSDPTDDVTQHWPDDREVVDLGTLTLDAVVPPDEAAARQKHDIFDPTPRVTGVEPSADPIIDMRASVYLISGRQRREACRQWRL